MTPAELRKLAEDAEWTINYAFEEPYVAISAEDVLTIADRIAQLEAALRAALSLIDPHTSVAHERTYTDGMHLLFDKCSSVETMARAKA